jgi:hypothetical protein
MNGFSILGSTYDEISVFTLHQDLLDTLGPLAALKYTVEKHTALKPIGIVLPGSLRTDVRAALTHVLGLPVLWDHRPDAQPALTYAPPTPRT